MENKLRIREILRKRGISVKDFAKELGIERQNVYSVFKNPSWLRLRQCSEILNMPIPELFEKDNLEINGFIEYKGTIYQIKDMQSFQNLINVVNSTVNK